MNSFDKHRPRKRFGQHFLRDHQIIQQIIHAIAPQAQDTLVEIGPGEGVLTDPLLPSVKKLHVIEIDRDLAMSLEKKMANQQHVQVHCQDVLQFDFNTISVRPQSLRIVGNLPYNISSPLLFKLFAYRDLIKDMHFMLQKEVVMRMVAPVGSADYNRLSVMTQYFCNNESLFEIQPSAFFPPPKVVSAFVRMIPHTPELVANDLQLFAAIVKTAFTYRRKTLHNCLKGIIDDQALAGIDIDVSLRPQQLSVTDFVKISNFISRRDNEIPTHTHRQ